MALEASKDKFIVGMTDLGGIMDIAASLRGSNNLIIDLFKHPRRVKELCWQILELWHSCYEELHTLLRKGMEGSSAWMAIWCQERWYPIQCDLSAVLSPRLFEAFALPLLREQCKRLDHTIYHWDGPGQIVHLDALLSIKELDGIQWTPGAGQPGTSSPVWFPLYRKIQRKNKRLVLLGVDKESLDFLLKELSPRGLLIQTNCTTEDEARELMKRIGRS
jgi:5-methyltetrahydrofolate--homocysteine methyltransferase